MHQGPEPQGLAVIRSACTGRPFREVTTMRMPGPSAIATGYRPIITGRKRKETDQIQKAGLPGFFVDRKRKEPTHSRPNLKEVVARSHKEARRKGKVSRQRSREVTGRLHREMRRNLIVKVLLLPEIQKGAVRRNIRIHRKLTGQTAYSGSRHQIATPASLLSAVHPEAGLL